MSRLIYVSWVLGDNLKKKICIVLSEDSFYLYSVNHIVGNLMLPLIYIYGGVAGYTYIMFITVKQSHFKDKHL